MKGAFDPFNNAWIVFFIIVFGLTRIWQLAAIVLLIVEIMRFVEGLI
jgi:hypothetical protein